MMKDENILCSVQTSLEFVWKHVGLDIVKLRTGFCTGGLACNLGNMTTSTVKTMCPGEPPGQGGVLCHGSAPLCGLALSDVLDDVHMWGERSYASIYPYIVHCPVAAS